MSLAVVPDAARPQPVRKPQGSGKTRSRESSGSALAERGYLAAKDQSGELDSATRKALQSFQEENHLPATGTPDDRTIRQLGLDVAHVFKASP